jgi:hypothetical protein
MGKTRKDLTHENGNDGTAQTEGEVKMTIHKIEIDDETWDLACDTFGTEDPRRQLFGRWTQAVMRSREKYKMRLRKNDDIVGVLPASGWSVGRYCYDPDNADAEQTMQPVAGFLLVCRSSGRLSVCPITAAGVVDPDDGPLQMLRHRDGGFEMIGDPTELLVKDAAATNDNHTREDGAPPVGG